MVKKLTEYTVPLFSSTGSHKGTIFVIHVQAHCGGINHKPGPVSVCACEWCFLWAELQLRTKSGLSLRKQPLCSPLNALIHLWAKGARTYQASPWRTKYSLCHDKRTRWGLISDLLCNLLTSWENYDTFQTFPAFHVAGNISSWNVMCLYVLMCNFASNKSKIRKRPANSHPVARAKIWVWTDILNENVARMTCLDGVPEFLLYRESWRWLAMLF